MDQTLARTLIAKFARLQLIVGKDFTKSLTALRTDLEASCEVLIVPELAEGEVSLRVLIGLVAHQPLKANFFPGILEGLVGRLGLAPPGITDPPTSVREGVACHWAAVLRGAVRRMEEKDVDLRQVTWTMVPHGLHLDYDLDFQTRRVDDVAPTLTSPLLSGLVSNIRQLERLGIPGEPASFKVDEDLWGHGRAPPVHLTTMGWHPRDELVKGRPRKMSLLAKERVLRISLLHSLTSRK